MKTLSTLAANTRAGSHERARLCAMHRHVEMHLDDEGLDARSLSETFGMSRAALYRVFSPLGGVRSYIEDRRIERILSELARTPPEWGIVRKTAERYGYRDIAVFHRSFRRRTGVTPGSMVGTAAPGGRASEDTRQPRQVVAEDALGLWLEQDQAGAHAAGL